MFHANFVSIGNTSTLDRKNALDKPFDWIFIVIYYVKYK